MKTYPEMDRKIVDLLRESGETKQLYTAARIVELEAVLLAYEKWEADLIMCDNAWRGNLPALTQGLYDELLELQAMRNDALEGVG